MEKQPRNIIDVINQLLAAIPEDETEVRRKLQSLIDELPLIAPEANQLAWIKLMNICENWMPDPKDPASPPWVAQCQRIVAYEE